MESFTVRIITALLVVVILINCFLPADSVTFQFPRYTFKKKRDDRKFKYAKQRVEVLPDCQGKLGLEHTKCQRRLMAPRCYQEIYGFDELEEGEIDIRFNSYKGCLSQQVNENVNIIIYNRIMEVESREMLKCNLCAEEYTNYDLLLKHCRNAHIKIETESSSHVVNCETKSPNESEDMGEYSSILETISCEEMCNNDNFKLNTETGTEEITSCFNPQSNDVGDKTQSASFSHSETNGFMENSHCKDSAPSTALDNVNSLNHNVIKEETESKDCNLFISENSDFDKNSDSRTEIGSYEIELNLDFVKNETNFDVRTQKFKDDENFPSLNSEDHGHKYENNFSKSINLKKILCVELTRVDYLLEAGMARSSVVVNGNKSQGLEERFEIKIERDEDTIVDIPISDVGLKTDELSKIKMEDSNEAVMILKYEDIKNEDRTLTNAELDKIHSRCYICDKKLANRSAMFRHLREFHKGMSREEWDIYREVKAKEKLISLTCDICNKVSETQQENKRHKLKHVKVKDFQCHVCGELFRLKQSLRQHVAKHTEIKHYQCEYCHLTAYTKSRLKIHMRTHTKEKPFACEICGSKFSSNDILKVHVRSHTGEKPFTCDVCNKAFASGTLLKVHSTIHTGVKRFQCKMCDRSFSQNIHLKTHVRVHTGERPFKCTECDKKFSRKHHLESHARIHTGEKPFQCTVCSQKFALKQYLVSHMRVHTGEKPYKCSVCHLGFSQYTEQKIHTKRHLNSDYIRPKRNSKTRRSSRVKDREVYTDDNSDD